MLPVVFGTKKSRLFSRNENKQSAAFRLLRQSGPHARDFQHHAASGGIIDSAVVNAVSIHRYPDSEVIPMRREQNDLRFHLSIRPVYPPDNIPALDLTQLYR